MIRVLVNGAKGKMGLEVVGAASSQKEMELVAQADLADDLAKMLDDVKPDVAVDFTHPSCGFENGKTFLRAGIPAVIGTTGFSSEELVQLHELALEKNTSVLVAPNFCIGAVLMMRFAEQAALFMPDAEVIELHHPAKADAPSGTARLTAEKIAGARKESVEAAALHEGECFRGGDVAGVQVHSVRLPGLVAHQEVIFGGVGQVLTIRHDSLNRGSFMPGVMMGIRSVRSWKGLVYGLDRVLFPEKSGIQTGV